MYFYLEKCTMAPVLETLMEMSAGSAEAAHVRFEEIGDGWIASY